MAITISVRGVSVESYVSFSSVMIQDTMEVAGDTCNFDLYSYNDDFTPIVGNEVIVEDGSTREFGGIITDVRRTKGEGSLIIYSVTCIDYTFMLDRRYINNEYSEKQVSNGSSDSILEDVLLDLKNAAIGDSTDGSGDPFYNAFYDSLDPSRVTILSPILKKQSFKHVLPSQVISTLAESCAMLWWVDFYKRINFKSISSDLATHLPINDGVRTLDVEDNSIDYYNLTLEDSIQGLGTKAIIKDAQVKSIGTIVDGNYIIDSTMVSGDEPIVFKLRERPFTYADIASVTRSRSGVSTNIVKKLLHVDRAVENKTTSTLVSGTGSSSVHNVYFYLGKQGNKDATLTIFNPASDGSNRAALASDIFEVTYNYPEKDIHENIDTSHVFDAAVATGGDGYHEFIYTQPSQIAYEDIDALDRIARVLLDRKSLILKRGSFQSYTKGWQAGQMFNLKWDKENINIPVWAITVSKTIRTPADAPNISSNIIESSVQFANVPRGLRM